MTQEQIDRAIAKDYAAGFTTEIESDTLPPGLTEDTIRFISAKKNEPEWLLEWRLGAFQVWREMAGPDWAHVDYPEVDFQSISYYSQPKSMEDRPKVSMKSIRSCWRPMKNWAFRSTSRRRLPAWPLMLCLTRSP